jgi:hypothetical protein
MTEARKEPVPETLQDEFWDWVIWQDIVWLEVK